MLTISIVLRPQIHLHYFHFLLSDLDGALCGSTKHTIDVNQPFLSGAFRKWVSHRFQWISPRSLHRQPDPSPHDAIYHYSIYRAFTWPHFRWLHQPIYNLVRCFHLSLAPLLTQCSFRRWTFYVFIIWLGAMLAATFSIPETYHPVLLARKAAALRKSTGNEKYYSALERANTSKCLP
jgi:hypothetical protein